MIIKKEIFPLTDGKIEEGVYRNFSYSDGDPSFRRGLHRKATRFALDLPLGKGDINLHNLWIGRRISLKEMENLKIFGEGFEIPICRLADRKTTK